MASQELVNYIKQRINLGNTKEDIKKDLIKAGWQESDVEEGLKEVSLAVTAPATSPVTNRPTSPAMYNQPEKMISAQKPSMLSLKNILFVLAVIVLLSIIGVEIYLLFFA